MILLTRNRLSNVKLLKSLISIKYYLDYFCDTVCVASRIENYESIELYYRSRFYRSFSDLNYMIPLLIRVHLWYVSGKDSGYRFLCSKRYHLYSFLQRKWNFLRRKWYLFYKKWLFSFRILFKLFNRKPTTRFDNLLNYFRGELYLMNKLGQELLVKTLPWCDEVKNQNYYESFFGTCISYPMLNLYTILLKKNYFVKSNNYNKISGKYYLSIKYLELFFLFFHTPAFQYWGVIRHIESFQCNKYFDILLPFDYSDKYFDPKECVIPFSEYKNNFTNRDIYIRRKLTILYILKKYLYGFNINKSTKVNKVLYKQLIIMWSRSREYLLSDKKLLEHYKISLYGALCGEYNEDDYWVD